MIELPYWAQTSVYYYWTNQVKIYAHWNKIEINTKGKGCTGNGFNIEMFQKEQFGKWIVLTRNGVTCAPLNVWHQTEFTVGIVFKLKPVYSLSRLEFRMSACASSKVRVQTIRNTLDHRYVKLTWYWNLKMWKHVASDQYDKHLIHFA